jgi:hypothetical protein
VGLLNPLNLLLGLSLAALVAIYLRAQARPTIEVSSLALFDEAPAPVARSRILRVDLLFWLEAAALATLTLVAAGFYVRMAAPVNRPLRRALIFDLGASMNAVDANGTRLAAAQRQARAIVDGAPPGDQFKVVGYALEARIMQAQVSRKPDLEHAIDALRATAVAARPSALRAALNSANTAEKIDLFTDHPPAPELLEEARTRGALVVHQVGSPVDNLAVLALEPGTPKTAEGRCLVRNFAYRPQTCELRIDLDGRQVFDSPLMIEPRAVAAVRFGPIPQGGVLHAHITPADGLAADNDRYALAPKGRVMRALVVSPDNAVRDDLARVLLAVNPGFQVTTRASALDSSPAADGKQAEPNFDLAILHDTNDTGSAAPAHLFIFPPLGQTGTGAAPIPVTGTASAVELQSRAGVAPLATPVLLGAARLFTIPGWMDALAQGADTALGTTLPLAATGYTSQGAVGVIAFDVRNHLLLDPDRLDALLLAIDTIKVLSTPPGAKVVATGDLVTMPTFAATTLIAPDSTRTPLTPDRWGRVRFRPLDAGRYILVANRQVTEVYANYYDELGSDLATSVAAPPTPREETRAPARPLIETKVVPLTTALAGVVLLILLLESAILLRRARTWGLNHV